MPKEQLSLRIARKGRSFLAKVIWWRDNFVGVAFRAESPAEPVSDLGERLRKSEIKKRQLQRQIDELLGEALSARAATQLIHRKKPAVLRHAGFFDFRSSRSRP